MKRAMIILALSACRTSTPAASKDVGAGGPAIDAAPVDAAAPEDAAPEASPTQREIGPFELPFDGSRTVYFVAPRKSGPARLIANLHGVCNPPGYACGYWVQAAADVGFLVCPTGNSTCGPKGPPTWTEPMTKMDEDLERAIAVVDAKYPGDVSRDGAVLTGFSLGAYAAANIARTHPGRWPYLILTEANVELDAASLQKAGVRAVAMLAGERGAMIGPQKRTIAKLEKQGFPARFWTMKDAGHHYSADIDTLMAEAIAFVIAQ
jgi:hypothetical protein